VASLIKFVPKTKHTISYAPLPEPAVKLVPDWYKDHDRYTTDAVVYNRAEGTTNKTIKSCMAIFDSITAGYILKFPVDVMIDATGKRIVYSHANNEEKDIVSMHSPEQVKGFPFSRDTYMDEVFRINPQWAVKTEEGVSCMFIHPMFHENLPFRVINGVVDTDNFMSDGFFSMIIERGFKGVIKQGTPFVQVIPFRREEYELVIPEFSEYEDEAIGQRYVVRSTFENGYKKNMWQRKKYH
jgi:hypothetical protein